MSIKASWSIHGDGKNISTDGVVAPGERLVWGRTVAIGAQHVLAMFGSTFLVPLLTGLSPSTTLFFSAIGTIGFLLITGNRLPSYLGSSFAFIAPIASATANHGQNVALGGVVMVGVLLAIVGLIVHKAGTRWIEISMPPVVTGSIVALIGLNLAPVAKSQFESGAVTAFITLISVVLITVVFRGILGRLAILLGAVVGSIVAAIRGEWNFETVLNADGSVFRKGVADSAWVGLPEFHSPEFNFSVLALFIPVVLVLISENIGHIKSVSAMTGENYDDVTGRALIADGVATTLAGAGGGSGTTTYAENIGVMAATRVYSTAAYWVAAFFALLLSLSPKFGAVIGALPGGVLGGIATVLFGLIAILGARIWVENKVDFSNPINLTTAGISVIIGTANFVWGLGDMVFEGIALGTVAAFAVYHVMTQIAKRRTPEVPLSIATQPEDIAGDDKIVIKD